MEIRQPERHFYCSSEAGSSASTPFVSAPSSPSKREAHRRGFSFTECEDFQFDNKCSSGSGNGKNNSAGNTGMMGFYYSAPTSPMQSNVGSPEASAPASPLHPFSWDEENRSWDEMPGTPKLYRGENFSTESEFQFSSTLSDSDHSAPTSVPADELFFKGKILPFRPLQPLQTSPWQLTSSDSSGSSNTVSSFGSTEDSSFSASPKSPRFEAVMHGICRLVKNNNHLEKSLKGFKDDRVYVGMEGKFFRKEQPKKAHSKSRGLSPMRLFRKGSDSCIKTPSQASSSSSTSCSCPGSSSSSGSGSGSCPGSSSSPSSEKKSSRSSSPSKIFKEFIQLSVGGIAQLGSRRSRSSSRASSFTSRDTQQIPASKIRPQHSMSFSGSRSTAPSSAGYIATVGEGPMFFKSSKSNPLLHKHSFGSSASVAPFPSSAPSSSSSTPVHHHGSVPSSSNMNHKFNQRPGSFQIPRPQTKVQALGGPNQNQNQAQMQNQKEGSGPLLQNQAVGLQILNPGVRQSSHGLHYKSPRTNCDDVRRKTFLPYKQGLLGCLGCATLRIAGLSKTLQQHQQHHQHHYHNYPHHPECPEGSSSSSSSSSLPMPPPSSTPSLTT